MNEPPMKERPMNQRQTMLALRQRNRNKAFESTIKALKDSVEKDGLTRKAIAERLGKDPAQITRLLSGPANWTLDTLSDLLFAAGAVMDYRAVRMEALPKSNHFLTLEPASEPPRVSVGRPPAPSAVSGGRAARPVIKQL